MKTWLKKHDKKIQKKSGVSDDVWGSFKKRRKSLIRSAVVSGLLTFVSLAIVGTQLFYPFHMVIGVGLYLISFIPFLYRIYLSRNTWQKYKAYGLVGDFVKKERRRMLFTILFFVIAAVLLWLRPLHENPFSEMTDKEISILVNDDLYRSVTAMDYLETTGNDLLLLLEESESNANDTEKIDRAFGEFLQAIEYSESLVDMHRFFASIPYSMWDERLKSFLISYSLYVKKYEIVHRIMVEVSGDEHSKKALNHFNPGFGRGDIYTEMVNRFLSPKTRIRLSGGYYYEKLFIGDEQQEDVSFLLLRDKSYSSYVYLRSNILKTIAQAPEVIGDGIEKEMFDTWFPIQKGAVTAIGKIIISTRGNEGLIESADALKMEKEMLPGDIMLQRRNWHVSNVGIPGFWTHNAIYTGDLSTLNNYFSTEFPFKSHETFSDYLESEFPEVYKNYLEENEDGSTPSVIEAVGAGVVIQSLAKSADADFVVVLRASLTKQDKLLALIKAFSNYGKPYDFNFDFDTRDAIVCSELIYDAYYEDLPEKNGLHIITSELNGRKIVSPLDIANKYVDERNSIGKELEFIYFLMSDEETKEVWAGTETDFVRSIEWSKFSFLQEQ